MQITKRFGHETFCTFKVDCGSYNALCRIARDIDPTLKLRGFSVLVYARRKADVQKIAALCVAEHKRIWTRGSAPQDRFEAPERICRDDLAYIVNGAALEEGAW